MHKVSYHRQEAVFSHHEILTLLIALTKYDPAFCELEIGQNEQKEIFYKVVETIPTSESTDHVS